MKPTLLVLAIVSQCSLTDRLADALWESQSVHRDEPVAERRGPSSPDPAPPTDARAAKKPRDYLAECTNGWPSSCNAGLRRAETEARKRELEAVGRPLCEGEHAEPPATLTGHHRESFHSDRAALCQRLAAAPGLTVPERQALLKRGCMISTEPESCFGLAFPIYNEKDELYDPVVALAMLRRGCELGHGVSCRAVPDLADAVEARATDSD